MKPVIYALFFIAFIFAAKSVAAQTNYAITGTVTDEKGKPLKAATVFISDSKIITSTGSDGKFLLANLEPGSFKLSVTSIGYAPYNKSVIINGRSVDLQIALTVKPIVLNEVFIGKGNKWDRYYTLFTRYFLGATDNADQCTIQNPKVINFSTNKNMLLADADDLLIIENNSLGYRIKYLLKKFQYNMLSSVVSYDGDASYEELPGTDAMKSKWAAKRLEAYNGSLMHFIRSVYSGNTLKEGFMMHQVSVGDGKSYFDKSLLDIKSVATVMNASFVSMSFTSIYVVYDPKKAAKPLEKVDTTKYNGPMSNGTAFNSNSSLLRLYLDEAIIDKKGSYDYRAFLIQGNWSKKLVGDQLPFEYQPPVIDK